ncbi:MAG: hypothetical protein ABL958_15420 [Bdellovibrionia bacterium]
MPVEFNHTIVHARDKRESAEFVSEILGLPRPGPVGFFRGVYFEDPSKNFLEIITVPYGSWKK